MLCANVNLINPLGIMITVPQNRIEAIGDQLRGKISGKFQISAFLGGFGFALFGIQMTLLWSSKEIPKYLPYSISAMLAAICMYIAAVVVLDRLTMPKRFWSEDKNKENSATDEERLFSQSGFLVSEDLWQLRNRMMFYWISLDYVGIGLTILYLILTLLPATPIQLNGANSLTRAEILCQTAYLAVIIVIVTFGYFTVLWAIGKYVKKFKPMLRGPD